MSTTALTQIEKAEQYILGTKTDFEALAKIHRAVDFKREASFAIQALKKNNYLCQVAMKNIDSFKQAIINVAALGLSLNPVKRHAYLVPRGDEVCLDIGYLGYIHLAAECGAVRYAIAETVCENDTFKYRGLGKEPLHEFDPFSGDRGEIKGAYCVAKLSEDEFITTMMPIDEIFGIRDRSQGWKAFKAGKAKTSPWDSDEGEMIKKTVIRRAWKSWPQVNSERFEKAIDLGNDVDAIDFTPSTDVTNDPKIKQVHALLKDLGRPMEKFLEHLARTFKREIQSISDLTSKELDQTISMMNQFVQRKKEQSNESPESSQESA